MLGTSDRAQSFAEAKRTLNTVRSLDQTLQTVVEVAYKSLPGFDQVGVATLEKHKIVTRAFSGDLVIPLDEIQYGLREGPCSAVLQGSDAVSVSSLQGENRWPNYVPRARAQGVRSQMAVRLHINGCTLGGMNFYSTLSDDVSPDSRAFAQLLAAQAAISLEHVREQEALHGLQSRLVIGQAIGIVMGRYQMSEERAFAFLVRTSSHTNIKLRGVAQDLVDEANAKQSATMDAITSRGTRPRPAAPGHAR